MLVASSVRTVREVAMNQGHPQQRHFRQPAGAAAVPQSPLPGSKPQAPVNLSPGPANQVLSEHRSAIRSAAACRCLVVLGVVVLAAGGVLTRLSWQQVLPTPLHVWLQLDPPTALKIGVGLLFAGAVPLALG